MSRFQPHCHATTYRRVTSHASPSTTTFFHAKANLKFLTANLFKHTKKQKEIARTGNRTQVFIIMLLVHSYLLSVRRPTTPTDGGGWGVGVYDGDRNRRWVGDGT